MAQNLAVAFDEQAIIEEALANFAALLDDLDFAAELETLGIGRFQFLRRKQMQIELRGLAAALWRLALASSFPQDADLMFEVFLRRYGAAHQDKPGARVIERARGYWGMVEPQGAGDFSNIARHLVSFLEKDQDSGRPVTLKLALAIRSLYRFIFERLI